MAAIIPDEIKDISQLSDNEKVTVMYEYIRYMHEQLSFWSSTLEKRLLRLQAEHDSIKEAIEKEKN